MSGLDRGVQRERTALSWTRTGLGVVAVAALQLRQAAELGSTTGVVLGLGCATAGLALHLVGRARYSGGSARGAAGRGVPVSLRVATAVVLAVCLASAWSVLWFTRA